MERIVRIADRTLAISGATGGNVEIDREPTELVHVGLTALLTDAGAELFINSCYNYPTLTEVYKYATYDALGRRAARLKERAAAANGSAGQAPASEVAEKSHSKT